MEAPKEQAAHQTKLVILMDTSQDNCISISKVQMPFSRVTGWFLLTDSSISALFVAFQSFFALGQNTNLVKMFTSIIHEIVFHVYISLVVQMYRVLSMPSKVSCQQRFRELTGSDTDVLNTLAKIAKTIKS